MHQGLLLGVFFAVIIPTLATQINGLAIGGILAGTPGAIAVLPIVASYPIIETHVEQQKEVES